MAALALAWSLTGCPAADEEPGSVCDAAADSDGDGIADFYEGTGDFDGDGVPDFLDDDSDDDGRPDSVEAGISPCSPTDLDGDGASDFRDLDTDGDGLRDDEELALGTDPEDRDTDVDGVPDLVEVRGSGTDPLDDQSTIDLARNFFVVLPYQAPAERRPLRFSTFIQRADVFFLVDMTGSMQEERTNLIRGLLDVIVPGIESDIPDVQFGVGGLDDYPVGGYGFDCDEVDGLARCDLPFYLLREIGPSDDDRGAWSLAAGPTACPQDPSIRNVGTIVGTPNGTPDLLEAVEGLPCHGGNDDPESYVPALHATATGMGLTWSTGSIPAQTCPVSVDEEGLRRGYPCFRPGSLPIVLLIGDSNFHNGVGGFAPYSFTAPTYDDTVTALNGIGARVISLFSGPTEVPLDWARIAFDTGTIRSDRSPLVFTMAEDGTGLDTTVVEAVSTLVGATPQTVSTRADNVEGNPDEFDATRFIRSVRPIQGYQGSRPGGFESKTDTDFRGVIPGTVVEFEVEFVNQVRPVETVEVHRARIHVVGNGVADLDSREVYILVPSDDGGPILL